MITISLTTIIAGAVVVSLAILGSLINPFLRSLRFPEAEDLEATDGAKAATESQPEAKTEPMTVLITAHDSLPELKRNLPHFLQQKYAPGYQVIVVCQSTDGETQDYLKRMAAEYPHLYYTYIPESSRYMSARNCRLPWESRQPRMSGLSSQNLAAVLTTTSATDHGTPMPRA